MEVVEIESVHALIEAGVVVITVGGGGIPVIDDGKGGCIGTAAVIDKDYASSLLARLINADLFIISTAVEKIAINFGKPNQKWLDKMTLSEAKAYLAEGIHFAKGSMAPKIQAIIMPDRKRQGLFYSYQTMAKALAAYGEKILKDEKGVKHDWYRELAQTLLECQNKEGYWINESDRWFETDKVLVTTYALLALNQGYEDYK